MHIIYKSTICLQMPLCDAFNSGFKRWALDRRVDGEEWVQQYLRCRVSASYHAVYQPRPMRLPTHLDICLPEVDEECADAVVVLDVVQEDKLDCATFSHVAAGETHLQWG